MVFVGKTFRGRCCEDRLSVVPSGTDVSRKLLPPSAGWTTVLILIPWRRQQDLAVASSNDLGQLLLQVGLLGKPTETKIRSECSSQFARWTDSNHSVIVQLTVYSYQYVR